MKSPIYKDWNSLLTGNQPSNILAVYKGIIIQKEKMRLLKIHAIRKIKNLYEINLKRNVE
jgi:hypothetical protein